jgi:predicted RNA-binding Zn ribbon-like protein
MRLLDATASCGLQDARRGRGRGRGGSGYGEEPACFRRAKTAGGNRQRKRGNPQTPGKGEPCADAEHHQQAAIPPWAAAGRGRTRRGRLAHPHQDQRCRCHAGDGVSDEQQPQADAAEQRGPRRRRPALTEDQASALTDLAERVREVFTAASSGDVASAAAIVNDLLEEFGAAPRLDPARGRLCPSLPRPRHKRRPRLGAGIAAGLALAIGSDLAGRLGVCQADPCDRVFIDTSRNLGKRFCSSRCQSRVTSAAHRTKNKG